MVRVPTYQRQVATPRPQPMLEQSLASPAAFGAQQAQAISQAGAQVQQSALQVGEVFADLRKRQDEDDALAAVNALNDKMRALMDEGDNAYNRQQGRGAVEAYGRLPGDIDSITSEIKASLSPGAAQVFERVADRRVHSTLDGYASYARQQADAALARDVEVLKQTMLTEYLDNPLDPTRRETTLDLAMAEMDLLADRQSLGADAKKLLRDEFVTQAHAGALDRLLSNEMYQEAEDYFEKHGEEMVGKVKDQATNSIRNAGIKRRGRDVALEVWRPVEPDVTRDNVQATEASMIAEIQSRGLPVDVEDEAIRRVRDRLRQHATVLEERQTELVQTAEGIIGGAPNEMAARAKTLDTMDLDQRSRNMVTTMLARRFAPGELKPTIENTAMVEEIRDAILEGRTFTEDGMPITADDIRQMALEYGFTVAQFRDLLDTHKQWNNGDGVFVPPSDIKKTFELLNTSTRWADLRPDEARYIVRHYQREAERLGKALNDRQIYEIMVDLVSEQSGWGGGPKYRLEARGREFDPESIAVPPSEAARIRQDWAQRRKGVPTPQQIAEEYAREAQVRTAAAGMRRTDIAAVSAAAREQTPQQMSPARAQAEANLANVPDSVRRIILEENKQPTAQEWPNPSPLENAASFKYLLSVESAAKAAERRSGYDGLPSNIRTALDRGQAYVPYLEQKYRETDGDFDRMLGTGVGSNVYMRQMERFVPQWVEAARVYFQWRNEMEARPPEVTRMIQAADALAAGESGRRVGQQPLPTMPGY